MAGTAVLAALVVITIALPRPALITSVNILFAAWLVLALHCGYHLLRAHRWRERQRAEWQARQDLTVPDNVPLPTSFHGVAELDEAQHAELKQTPDYQGRYRATGIRVGFLPALAVGFVSFQGIFFDTRGPAALGLAFAQCLLLLVLVLVVRTNMQPNLEWVLSRIRAELLRREQYLRLAQVGPYLGLDPDTADEIGRQRVARIAAEGLEGLEQLASGVDQVAGAGLERSWLDALWQMAAGSADPAADTDADSRRPDRIRERACSYLHYRMGKQLIWFGLTIAACRRAERRISRMTQTTVLAAVAVALINASLLSANWQHGGAYAATALLAAVLPTLCTGLFAIHELFAFRNLAVSYDFTRRELTRCQASLQALIDRIDAGAGEARSAVELQVLVLQAEGVLTLELQRWVMLIYKPRFDASL